MTTIEFTDPYNHEAVESVEFSARTGGLILVGPAIEPPVGLGSLVCLPGAVPVMIESAGLQGWDTARNEVALQARRISTIIRHGETPVVYLDAHVQPNKAIPVERQDFVAERVGQLIVGLADVPAYVGIVGSAAAPQMLLQGLGSFAEATVGTMPCGLPLMQVGAGVYRDLHVAIGSAGKSIAAFGQFFEWAEARRTLPDLPIAV